MVNPSGKDRDELSYLLLKAAMPNSQMLWEQQKSKILSQLSPDDVQQLMASSVRLTKPRGELLYPGGSDIPRIYIVDQGYVRFCRISEAGDRLISGFLGPADLFGSLFPDNAPGQEEDFLEVVRETRLIGIETPVFKSVLTRYPDFLLRMLEILETRKKQLEQRVHSLMTKDVYAQTAEILLELSQKFGETCTEKPETEPDLTRDIALTHQEIADLVGVARPTMSKIIGEFMKTGLLHKHHHHLCLHHIESLHHIAEHGQKALANAGVSITKTNPAHV